MRLQSVLVSLFVASTLIGGGFFACRSSATKKHKELSHYYQRVVEFGPDDQPETDGELSIYDACWTNPDHHPDSLFCVEVTEDTGVQNKGLEPYSKEYGPYSNDQIHQWACDSVNEYVVQKGIFKQTDAFGCYDACLSMSLMIGADGVIYDQHSTYRSSGSKEQPVGLSFDDHPHRIVNACAITLIGSEW